VIGPARNGRLIVEALEVGADDYVGRPVRSAELLARVRAQLRRRQRTQGFALTFGPLSFDPHGREAWCDGKPLALSSEELALLALLAARPGNSYPADFLTANIWGQARRHETTLLLGTVARLRSLIEHDPARPTVLGGDQVSGFWLGGAVRERALQ
jgi:DNA-binding response OmpR family regulator